MRITTRPATSGASTRATTSPTVSRTPSSPIRSAPWNSKTIVRSTSGSWPTCRYLQPRQYEFSRLNLNYTVTSKRKLKQLVDEGHVSGWDDPRMSTLSGYRRRGYTPESIRNFCEMIGVNRASGVVDIGMLEVQHPRPPGRHRAACHVRAETAQGGDHQLPRRAGGEPRVAASSEGRHGSARTAVRSRAVHRCR